jgi:hypothetical protein
MSTTTEPFVSLTADALPPNPAEADAAKSFRRIKLLVGAYVTLSVLTLVAIALLRNHHGIVNSAVWTRGTIVVLSSLLLMRFARRAANGARRAFLRLRIISAVMVAAIAVIVALPGPFPVWMKIEQAVCGLLLIGVTAFANRRQVRGLFAGEDRE